MRLPGTYLLATDADRPLRLLADMTVSSRRRRHRQAPYDCMEHNDSDSGVGVGFTQSPVEDQAVDRPVLKAGRPTRYSIRTLQPQAGPARCRRKFLRFYPGGFRDQDYLDLERGYKWDAHQQWVETLDHSAFRSLPMAMSAHAHKSGHRCPHPCPCHRMPLHIHE